MNELKSSGRFSRNSAAVSFQIQIDICCHAGCRDLFQIHFFPSDVIASAKPFAFQTGSGLRSIGVIGIIFSSLCRGSFGRSGSLLCLISAAGCGSNRKRSHQDRSEDLFYIFHIGPPRC